MNETIERFSRAGPRGRGREWATLGEHPLSWLLSNNRLEKVPVVSVPHTSSNRLLLSNQDKGCTPSVAHSLPLPLGPALLNLWNVWHAEELNQTSHLYSASVLFDRVYHISIWSCTYCLSSVLCCMTFIMTPYHRTHSCLPKIHCSM